MMWNVWKRQGSRDRRMMNIFFVLLVVMWASGLMPNHRAVAQMPDGVTTFPDPDIPAAFTPCQIVPAGGTPPTDEFVGSCTSTSPSMPPFGIVEAQDIPLRGGIFFDAFFTVVNLNPITLELDITENLIQDQSLSLIENARRPGTVFNDKVSPPILHFASLFVDQGLTSLSFDMDFELMESTNPFQQTTVLTFVIKGAPREVTFPRRTPSHTVPLVEAISPCVEGASFDECTIRGPMFTITGRVVAPSGPLAPIGITVAEVQIIVSAIGDVPTTADIVVPLAADGTFSAEVPNTPPGDSLVHIFADTRDETLRGVGGFSFISVQGTGGVVPTLTFTVSPRGDEPLMTGRVTVSGRVTGFAEGRTRIVYITINDLPCITGGSVSNRTCISAVFNAEDGAFSRDVLSLKPGRNRLRVVATEDGQAPSDDGANIVATATYVPDPDIPDSIIEGNRGDTEVTVIIPESPVVTITDVTIVVLSGEEEDRTLNSEELLRATSPCGTAPEEPIKVPITGRVFFSILFEGTVFPSVLPIESPLTIKLGGEDCGSQCSGGSIKSLGSFSGSALIADDSLQIIEIEARTRDGSATTCVAFQVIADVRD